MHKVLSLVSVVVMLAGCGAPPDERPDVVLIVIDTLRADHLAAYGYGTETAPYLSSLAARGTVFERTHATSSWTAPSTASLLTSLQPVQHGVLSGFRATQERRRQDATVVLDRIPAEVETLAEVMQAAGYATFAVSDNVNIREEMGFAQGFDRFHNFNYETAEAVNGQVLAWAEEIESSRPYFLYLHYMDPHRPYRARAPLFRPGASEVETSLSAYDSEIHYCDASIRRLDERFGWDEQTLIIVTSDHGEEFLDHGGLDHGRTLYGEVLDVPLIVALPGSEPAPRRVAARSSLLDILPTLRSRLGLPPADSDRGHLLPLLEGGHEGSDERSCFADLRSAPWFGDRTLQSVIQGELKLIAGQPDSLELYDLAADPGELDDLASERPADVIRLWEYLQRSQASWPRHTAEPVEIQLDEETLRKLEALGYVR